jgi:hypothetical protein
MDAIRKSPNYAEGQIRALLSDLKSTNHAVRMKAVKRFQDYITTYRSDGLALLLWLRLRYSSEQSITEEVFIYDLEKDILIVCLFITFCF